MQPQRRAAREMQLAASLRDLHHPYGHTDATRGAGTPQSAARVVHVRGAWKSEFAINSTCLSKSVNVALPQ